MRNSTLLVLCALLAAGTVACGGKKEVRLRGGEKLNLNPAKEATPVRVKVYQLRDASNFDRANFEALWVDEGKELGDDLLDKPITKDVLPRKVGEKYEDIMVIYEEEKSLKPDTQFIGVAVLFTPEEATPEMQAKWKKAVPLDQVGGVIFYMDHYELQVKED